jgi:hypothetical protein
MGGQEEKTGKKQQKNARSARKPWVCVDVSGIR